MVNEINVKIKVKGEQKKLQAASDATILENQNAPTGIKIVQKVNDTLTFQISGDVSEDNSEILTVKHTITDFILHLRVALSSLEIITST